MKVVSAFRPFAPESPAHRKLGPFDWVGALLMLRDSVDRSCGCETVAITDVDTKLPGPSHQYVTTHRRLMLWILDVSARYLESPDFDQDTVFVSPDMLVFGDLRPWFMADLGVLVRVSEKHRARLRYHPLLNGVQWWSHAAKSQLIDFFEEALAVAQTLPEPSLQWGADTEPLVKLLSPIDDVGVYRRAGMDVAFIHAPDVMRSIDVHELADGHIPPWPTHAVVDFKFFRRKQLMRAYYDATLGVPA